MYVFESDRERELVYVHRTVYDGKVTPNPNELSEGRFWSAEDAISCAGVMPQMPMKTISMA